MDMKQYKIDILAVQETHISETGIYDIETSEGYKYKLYNSGKKYEDRTNDRFYCGVGFVAKENYKVAFTPISDRICFMTFLDEQGNKHKIINAHAHTLPNSEKDPRIRQIFYDELENIINTVGQSEILTVVGDFNAKTGTGYELYKENMGKFGKGNLNSNGEYLLNFANNNQLILTNTLFNHKMAHRSTWVCPERNITIRKNPIRNQIDYILVRIKHRKEIMNSRSYAGINTDTDHRLVIANLRFDHITKYQNLSTKKNEKYDFDRIENVPGIQFAYKAEVEKILTENESETEMTEQDLWNQITKACTEASKSIIGVEKQKNGRKIYQDDELLRLSKQQKDLRIKINAETLKRNKRILKRKRNEIMNKIHRKVQEIENKRLLQEIEEIENCGNDSNKMFKAQRTSQRHRSKDKIIVKNEKGEITDEEEATRLLTDYFKAQFNDDKMLPTEQIQPIEMTNPFTSQEVKGAIRSLKNNRSSGIDNIFAEQLKHGPDIITYKIASILNSIAKTGKYPTELKEGILVPLSKPNKKKGPVENTRPIILLSMIRKITAIIMLKRIHSKVDNYISINQAAYRKGRSATELVSVMKNLAEKAITSTEYKINFLMLDMSKAFDSVNRNTLLQDLKNYIQPDELHIISILLHDVDLTVRCGKTKGEKFSTNKGIPQGDSLSPVLFTLYLSRALAIEQDERQTYEHSYAKAYCQNLQNIPIELEGHEYSKNKRDNFSIDQQFADDIGWASTSNDDIDFIKNTVPEKLQERHLKINEDKTEEYEIKRDGNENWKKCIYLGSMLGNEEDINRRKQLAMTAFFKHKHILTSKKINLKTRMRLLDAYVTSIFMYNSELWTLTKKQEEMIDAFQRNILRKVMNVRWPYIITNEELHYRTEQNQWSDIIKERRLRWLGHLMRLPTETSAKVTLNECCKTHKRPPGCPKTTWISRTNKDLQEIDPSFKIGEAKIEEIAQDRSTWRLLTRNQRAHVY